MTRRSAAAIDPNQLGIFPLPPAILRDVAAGDDEDGLWGYFFATRNGHRVKHGITNDVERRQRDLQTGAGDPLVLAGAYPTYTPPLERAVGTYFGRLRLPGTREWFEPWTVEFRITALGGGLPPSVYEQYAEALAARTALLNRTDGAPSIQARVTQMMKSGELRDRRESEQWISGVMQNLLDNSTFAAVQPLVVQVDQAWRRRLNGDVPFDLNTAELRPAYVDLSQMTLHET